MPQRALLNAVAPRLLCASLFVWLSPIAAAQDSQAEFRRGVVALHHFEYEDANETFRRIQGANPGFAMAYWGEAMTYHQTLWRNENIAAARQALAKLGPTRAARAARAVTATDKALIEAVDALFGDGDSASRRRGYADAMGALYARSPEDPDVASFYALALLGTMSRSLIGHVDSHEGHSDSLAGSETQRRVAEVLERVLSAHPQHPGALHYLLHNYDDPAHARLALPAARTYATVAPESSHARHMPAHIFMQLGMWTEAAAADRAAFAASDAWIKAKGLGTALRSYHALSWLQYELLQQGRYREAWATLDEIAPTVKETGDLGLLSELSSMRARYVVETRRWDVLARERNFGNVNELYAIGVSAARSGNPSLAELARQQLAARSQSEQEGDLRPAIAIMEREVAAVIEFAAGRGEQAVGILRAAAEAELKLPPPLGLPAPIKPAPELLGEILLELGRPADAIDPFRRALERNANRSLSVLGLARAAAAAGSPDVARERYRELLENYSQADADLPDLTAARAALASAGASPSYTAPAIGVTAGLIAIVATGIALRRRGLRGDSAAAGPAAKRAARDQKRRRNRRR